MSEFKAFMMDYMKNCEGKDMKEFSTEKFETISFDANNSVVIGIKSDIFDILVFDRRGAETFIPKSELERRNSHRGAADKGSQLVIPVQRSFNGEYIGYGVLGFGKEAIAVLIDSGDRAHGAAQVLEHKN